MKVWARRMCFYVGFPVDRETGKFHLKKGVLISEKHQNYDLSKGYETWNMLQNCFVTFEDAWSKNSIFSFCWKFLLKFCHFKLTWIFPVVSVPLTFLVSRWVWSLFQHQPDNVFKPSHSTVASMRREIRQESIATTDSLLPSKKNISPPTFPECCFMSCFYPYSECLCL